MISALINPPAAGRVAEARPRLEENSNLEAKSPDSGFAGALKAASTPVSPEQVRTPCRPTIAEHSGRLAEGKDRQPAEQVATNADRKVKATPDAVSEKTKSSCVVPSPATVPGQGAPEDEVDTPDASELNSAQSQASGVPPNEKSAPELVEVAYFSRVPFASSTPLGTTPTVAKDGGDPDLSLPGSSAGFVLSAGPPGAVSSRMAIDSTAASGARGRNAAQAIADAIVPRGSGVATPAQSEFNTLGVSTQSKSAFAEVQTKTTGGPESVTIKLGDALPPWASALVSSTGDNPLSASPKMASLSTETAPSSPEFANELGADIQLMLRDGIGRAELSLNPVDLGPIFIELKLRDQVADVAFSVTNPATRDAIEQSIPKLNDLLANTGVTLGDSNVAGDHARRGSGHGQPASATEGQSIKKPPDMAISGHSSAAGHRRLMAMAAASARGGIDHYA